MAMMQQREAGVIEGRAVREFVLGNAAGTEVHVLDFGVLVTRVLLADKAGRRADVVLGFDEAARYAQPHPYFGALVGRVANRIGGARFTLDGREYALAANDGANHLHGGVRGFDKVFWSAEPVVDDAGAAVRFALRSPDGDEGYPGNLDVRVTVALTEDNVLRFSMEAETDRPTPVNLCHHGYWNFAGHAAGDVLGHMLELKASAYTPSSAQLVPTGDLVPVDGTPLDFRVAKPVGRDMGRLPADPAAGNPGGYDHNFVVDGRPGSLRPAARVWDPVSGRGMEVWATPPGVQFYSGNFLDGTVAGKGGAVYGRHSGLCLETQHYPDSVHHPHFPSTILQPGETYRHEMEHRFFAD